MDTELDQQDEGRIPPEDILAEFDRKVQERMQKDKANMENSRHTLQDCLSKLPNYAQECKFTLEDSREESQVNEEPCTNVCNAPLMSDEAARRKAQPICTGVLDYFPDALLAVGELSRIGNEQHNPGEPLHWAKEKSTDEADALVRHLLDRGTLDTDGVRHSAKVAWRALALLQREIDAETPAPALEPQPEPSYSISIRLPIRDVNGDIYDMRESFTNMDIRDQSHGEALINDLAETQYAGRVVTLWYAGRIVKHAHYVAIPDGAFDR